MLYGRELLKGNTDSLLLYLISEEPMYGYRIIKELERRSKGYFCFREGTLYPALHRLERMGLVRGRWESLPNGQERRYYHITEQGLKVLAEKLSEWRGFSNAVNLVIQPATA
ncbi:MAG: helix-turn-helix transcriptional regulator [Chloroflexota bacterium]